MADDAKYDRRIYNLIINSKLKPQNGTVREYTLFDLFPTVLALAGAKIKGDKLGLGTNLFSDSSNLNDKYNFNYLNKETMMENEWFNREILHHPIKNHINFDFSVKFFEEPSKMIPYGDVRYF